MVDRVKIEAGILAGIIIILGAAAFTGNTYFCEDRGIVMDCDSLSKYYGLENGKCWNEDVGNKLCRSGWVKIKEARVEAKFNISQMYDCVGEKCVESKQFHVSYGTGEEYLCSYGDWGCCSYDVDRKTATCDSKYDGNCDGVCEGGESCVYIDFEDYPAVTTADTYDRLNEFMVVCNPPGGI